MNKNYVRTLVQKQFGAYYHFVRLPPSWMPVCLLMDTHTHTRAHMHTHTYTLTLPFSFTSSQFTQEVACRILKRRSPPFPPRKCSWDPRTFQSIGVLLESLSCDSAVGWHKKPLVSECLFGCLNHHSAHLLCLSLSQYRSCFFAVSYESLNIYLWRLNAPFHLHLALRALGRNHSILQMPASL